MKFFTEKGFEMRMARERELWEEKQRLMEEIRILHKQVDELRWMYETKTAAIKVNTDV